MDFYFYNYLLLKNYLLSNEIHVDTITAKLVNSLKHARRIVSLKFSNLKKTENKL